MPEFCCEWLREESEIVRPFLNGMPVLPRTRAVLEDLLRITPINLGSLAREIESDLGLLAKVLRTTLLEFDNPPERYPAPEECIALLGVASLKDIVRSAPVIEPPAEICQRLHETARDSRKVANLSRIIAIACDYPEPVHAYWAGLFHGLGQVPILLRSRVPSRQENTKALERMIGAALAFSWSLPPFISDVLQNVTTPRSARDSLLAAIVAFAREESRRPRFPKEHGRDRAYTISREGCA